MSELIINPDRDGAKFFHVFWRGQHIGYLTFFISKLKTCHLKIILLFSIIYYTLYSHLNLV